MSIWGTVCEVGAASECYEENAADLIIEIATTSMAPNCVRVSIYSPDRTVDVESFVNKHGLLALHRSLETAVKYMEAEK